MEKYIFNLKQIRLAMGADWRPYKNALEWWRLDEIDNGDPKWLEWVNGNPEKGILPNESLNKALSAARKEYYERKLRLRSRYGVNNEQIDNFYRMFIGYHPLEGMRSAHVGPYMVAEDTLYSIAKEAQELNIPLQPDALLKWAQSIPYPDKNLFQGPEGEKAFIKAKDLVDTKKRRILEVRADKTNKFGVFTHTYNRFSKKDVDNAIKKYISGLSSQFGSLFDVSDLCAVVKSLPENEVSNLDGNVKWDNEVVSLDPSQEGYQKLVSPETAPLNQGGSHVRLNAKGMMKLFTQCAQDGNWQDLYERGVEMVAKEKGKSVEETKVLLAQDMSFSNSLLKNFQSIKKELQKTGDLRANFVDVALSRKPKKNPTFGAQISSPHRISTEQWNTMSLKMEIMQSYVKNNSDLNLISDELNSARAKKRTIAQGTFTPDLVKLWIDAIVAEDNSMQKSKKKKQNRTSQEILATLTKDFVETEKNESLRDCGVEDLETAYKLLTMSYTKSELEFLDRSKRVPLQMPEITNAFAREGDPDISVTAKAMTQLRIDADSTGIPEKERVKALKSEILQEIGDVNQKMEEAEAAQQQMDFDVSEVGPEAGPEIGQEKTETPIPTEETINPSETPTAPEQVTPEGMSPEQPPEQLPAGVDGAQPQPQQKPLPKKKINLQNLFGNTLKGLIGLARDLDNNGKSSAAEEIHKIIRKYQGKI